MKNCPKSKLLENNGEKNISVTQQICAFRCLKKASGIAPEVFEYLSENLFRKKYITSEGAVSHNVLDYQQLSIARYQVSCYANNYFE